MSFTHRALSGILVFSLALPLAAAEPKRTYEADVRPILKAHCFQCHGEAGVKEGNLDVRLRRWLVAGGDSGAAIVPGEPGKSYLIERIENGEMPPEKKNPVSPKDLAILKEWIAAGASTARPEPEALGDEPVFTEEERNWWSFQPVKRPAVPWVKNADLASTPVDSFLLAALEKAAKDSSSPEAYRFAPLASRDVLNRRLSFDLLGLPPTPEEIAEFESDKRPDAWSRLVDRMLTSPHYGERWGRHWLDVAGYADSEGYTEEDRVRPHAYHYRDYVIRSFNANKPFDQFLQEQLAGDEMVSRDAGLTDEVIEKLSATGFLRMAPDGTASGGIDQMLARNQVVADTLQVVSTSLLGMTVHCAQCHDHRYDPISHVDYHRLRAIFEPALDPKNWKVPAARRVSLYTEAQRKQRAEIEAEAKKVDAARQERVTHYIDRTLEQELLLLSDVLRAPLRTAFHTPAAKRSPEEKALLAAHANIANIREGSLYLYERRRTERIKKMETRRAEKEQQYLAEARAKELEKLSSEAQEELTAALNTPVEKRTPEQTKLLAAFPNVIITAETLAELRPDAAAELDLYTKAAEEIRTTNIKQDLQTYSDKAGAIRATIPPEDFLRTLSETPGKVPATHLFHRGDHEQPKQKVEPGDLSVLAIESDIPSDDPNLPTTGRRLQYAKHLTSGKHPLVARVLVNRVWMHHFGRGLVNSPGDFGVLGEKPTHPELLDWLAAEFVESGWNLKHLHRLILLSSAYRQSSAGHPAIEKSDPDNRLYGRAPLRRLDAEAVRDGILVVSGQFNPKQFGEPVPVMEDEVGQIVIGQENLDGERKPTKAISLNGEEFRRSVYVQVRRSRVLGTLETFDTPDLSPNCVQRAESNVAPQSLWFMNSQFVVTSAKNFAERLIANAPGDPQTQVAQGWKLVFGKTPTPENTKKAVEFVNLQQKTIRETTPKISAEESYRQALATFCQALLSSNSFLYVE